MATIQTASFLLALGGDIGNTVPKFGIPASEIAVLQSIHGYDAVGDLVVDGEIEISNGEELERLRSVYAHAHDSNGGRIIDAVYPGRGAQVVRSIDDLGLQEEQFKAERAAAPAEKAKAASRKPRVKVDPAPVEAAPVEAAPADAAPVDDGENADAAFME